MADHTAAHSHAPSAYLPWWVQPAATVVVFTAFIIYGIWAALQGHGYFAPYLSPFYSPPITVKGIPISGAFWVVWAPFGFRATCYYYRKAYYRSYFLDPVACTIPEFRRSYTGETAFPFVINNVHRYFLYGAIIVLVFLWKDAIQTFFPTGRLSAHLGSLLFLANVILLSGYTFGCHAFRHMAGGNLDCYSCARGGRLRYGLWQQINRLNIRHAGWAWASLFSVGLADVYVRLLASGIIADPKVF
jgi:hypothetical protein